MAYLNLVCPFSASSLSSRPPSTGSSLWSVISKLRARQHLFPQVEVKFDSENASTTPVILHLRPHFDLLFSGYHQRLHTICLRKFRDLHPPVILRYKDTVISSGEEPLVKVAVTRTFGPTYPGDELRYPGVWFSFEDDAINETLQGGTSHTGSDHRSKEVKRIIVTQKETHPGERDALGEVITCPAMFGDISRAVIKVFRTTNVDCPPSPTLCYHIQIHHGVLLHFFSPLSSPLQIRLGETTAQDLNLDLGPPSKVHYKEDERMAIHSSSPQSDEDRRYTDCESLGSREFTLLHLHRFLQLLPPWY